MENTTTATAFRYYSVWPVTVLDAADVLLSENPYHGWHIGGLEIRNPFV